MLKTIIVDDEADALESIELILKEYCQDVSVIGTADNALDAIKIIQQKKPDLVFLDIEMPHGNGFDILESIPERKFDVIFITAYNQYAIKAFKFSAVAYILKPIDIDDLSDAVNKVIEKRKNKDFSITDYNILIENIKSSIPDKLVISTSKGFEYINIDEIIRIAADRSYSQVFLKSGKNILASRNLAEFQGLLKDRNFFRTHNSHLVNLFYVKTLRRSEGGYIEMTDGSSVAISRRKKDDFLNVMKKISRQ